MKKCIACGAKFDIAIRQCPACHTAPEIIDGYTALAPELVEFSDGFKADYFAQLISVETTNFWFNSRNRLIVWALKHYFPNAENFLEIGCGTGFVLSELERALSQLLLYGSDISTIGLKFAAKRLKKAKLFQMDAHQIPFEDEFDVMGAFDILEHIKNDQLVLSQMYQAVRKNGGIILTVPQHRFLWSHFDENACHRRRYSASELKFKVEQAGFEVIKMTSFVSLLLPLMLVSRLKQKRKPAREYDVMSELKLGGLPNTLLEKALHLEHCLINLGISLPFGGSLFLIANKPPKRAFFQGAASSNGKFSEGPKNSLFGIRGVLASPAVYRLFTNLIGYDNFHSMYVREYVRPREGDRVLDIGCGLGSILEYLPQVEYFGFDINQQYIEAAIKRFGNRGTFACKKLSIELIKKFSNYDIVLATGILHHFDDNEAMLLFKIAKEALKPGGRLITLDGCYEYGQSWITRFFLSKDRGKYIRTKDEYLSLASGAFEEVKVSLRNYSIRIPYTHIIMECKA